MIGYTQCVKWITGGSGALGCSSHAISSMFVVFRIISHILYETAQNKFTIYLKRKLPIQVMVWV
jgi:hypothetical protein